MQSLMSGTVVKISVGNQADIRKSRGGMSGTKALYLKNIKIWNRFDSRTVGGWTAFLNL